MTLPIVDISRLRIEGVEVDLTESDADPGIRCRVSLRVYDVRTGRRETVAAVTLVDRVQIKAERWPVIIGRAVERAIAHEIAECMTIDGKRAEDPHARDRTERSDTPTGWEELPPGCDCPRGRHAAIEWARAHPKTGTLNVCELAFARICDSLGMKGQLGYGGVDLPIPMDRHAFTYGDNPFDAVCFRVRVMSGKVHGMEREVEPARHGGMK